MTKGNLSKINTKLEPFIFNCAYQKRAEKWSVIKGLTFSSLAMAVIAAGLYWKFDLGNGNYLGMHKNDIEGMHKAESTHQSEGLSAKLASSIPSWKKGATLTEVIPFDFAQSTEETPELPLAANIKESILPAPVLFSSIQSLAFKETSNPVQLKNIQAPAVIKPQHSEAPKVAEVKNRAQPKTAQIKKSVKNTPNKSAKNYTIQLLASHKITVIEQFKRGNASLAKSKTHHIKNNHDAWYILTLGEFPSKNQAMLKIKNFPPELTKLNPWIRPVVNGRDIG